MRYLDEYRDAAAVKKLAHAIASTTTSPWSIMEVCGGQTHSILRFGLDQLLPESIRMIHGPGCPVCVTPMEMIDAAIELAQRPNLIFCSFGDMLRVPSGRGDLTQARARGADVRAVYSPLEAARLAQQNPDRQIVFFAVGFETTAPANAFAVRQARQWNLENFSLLVSHVRVPPALRTLLSAEARQIDGILAAGHVCAVMGTEEYQSISRDFRVPIVVTGFEPVDLLRGIHWCITQLEQGQSTVQNAYGRAVETEGNPIARQAIDEVFETTDRTWRGLGGIRGSGWKLRASFRKFDAWEKFGLELPQGIDDPRCRAGEILQGTLRPDACPHFGSACAPDRPLGAPMVSDEGACAAYYRYRRHGG